MRDDSDPAFTAGSEDQSFGLDIADGRTGLLMVGTTVKPTPSNPTGQVGSAWYSTNGASWTRLADLGPQRGQAVINGVRALPAGWLAAGRVTVGGRSLPTVWTVRSPTKVSAARLPVPGRTGAVVYDLAVTANRAVVAGLTADGRPLLWQAAVRDGRVTGRWRTEVAPSSAGTGWTQDRLALMGTTAVLVLYDSVHSEVWTERGVLGT
jgi:hypothetical protein